MKMKNSLTNLDGFPEPPAYQYATAPIYVEPMIGSGERITIIGVVSRKNDNLIEKLISVKTVEALFQQQSKNILGFADLVIKDLENHLQKTELSLYIPSLKGVFMGEVKLTRADNAQHALDQVARLHSFFYPKST